MTASITGEPKPADEIEPCICSRPMTAIEQQQHDDLQWAATALDVQRHEGKLVVIRKRRVVAVGSDRRALLDQAAKQEQCPWSELVVEVVPPGGLWEPPR